MAKSQIKGLNSFLRDMKHAPRELQNKLRKRAQKIAEPIAEDAKANARTPQQKLVTPSIRAVRDRIPVVKLGGGRKLKSTTPRRLKPSAGDVYFGADFGGGRGVSQFGPKNKGGTMIFPAVKGRRKQIADEYMNAVEDVFKGKT